MDTGAPTDQRHYDATHRAERFTYGAWWVDEAQGTLHCSYDLDGRSFTEVVVLGPGLPWSPAAREAARLVHLLAGVSYYKAGAAKVVDLDRTVVRPGEREFLQAYYLGGLGEYAYTEGVDLRATAFVGGDEQPAATPDRPGPIGGAVVPFGGGIDSFVTTDVVAAHRPGTSLYVNNISAAIERAAAVTGLPVLRTRRVIDPDLVRLSRPPAGEPRRVLNGHVPITAILSGIAVLAALLHGAGEVVMSNEWSASRGNLEVDGRLVNHQYSKSAAYEQAFRAVLARSVGGAVDWYSFLRPFSELWVARRFAGLEAFHPVVHSCNRAFYLDEGQRLEQWCGRCDKCCFIDLILAPFMPAEELARIFAGREPLADTSLLPTFRTLLGLGTGFKPFECVGDLDESRTAVTLAAARADRRHTPVLRALLDELGGAAAAARADADRFLRPLGDHAIPADLLAAALA